MDKFKKYLKEHQAEMDTDIPGAMVWEYIQGNISRQPVQRNVIKIITLYVAAACVLAFVSTILFTKKEGHKDIADKDNFIRIREKAKNDTIIVVQNTNVPGRQNEIAIIKTPVQRKTKQQVKIPTTLVSTEVSTISKSYNQLINFQLKKLRSTPVYAETPSYFSDFKAQLKQVDKDESAISNDIKVYGLSDELISQLINVYQQKLILLKRLQTEVNKMNNKIIEKKDPSVKPNFYHLDI